MTAVSCGTPAPVTTRVVQIEPGPMPTAGDDLHSRQAMTNRFDGFHDFFGVAVRGVDRDDIHFSFGHFDRALEEISGCTDRGSGVEAAMIVF